MADGYALPPEQLGTEEFVFTHKGMWQQRMYGLQLAAERGDEWLLVCDDDIDFKPDFAERMMEEMNDNEADLLVPHIGEFSPKKSNLRIRMFHGILGHRFESSDKKARYYVTIVATGGHVLHRGIGGNANLTQSGHFNCFMMRPECVEKMRLEEESWLDAAAYAYPDDQTFFYKAYLLGLRSMYCKSPTIRHLDHGSSAPDRRRNGRYADGRNFFIFWHRFLWQPARGPWRKLVCALGIAYREITSVAFQSLLSLLRRDTVVMSYIKGVRDGIAYVRSAEYRALRRVK